MIDHNERADWTAPAVCLVGRAGLDNIDPADNEAIATLSRNVCNGKSPAVVMQGAGGTAHSQTIRNRVTARVLTNDLGSISDQPILVSNGRPDNRAEIQAAGDSYIRRDGDLLS